MIEIRRAFLGVKVVFLMLLFNGYAAAVESPTFAIGFVLFVAFFPFMAMMWALMPIATMAASIEKFLEVFPDMPPWFRRRFRGVAFELDPPRVRRDVAK